MQLNTHGPMVISMRRKTKGFGGLDIGTVPRNALWVTCCGISFKKLEKRVDLFLNSLLSLICFGKTHGSILVNTIPV
jgi:hypothetical protein